MRKHSQLVIGSFACFWTGLIDPITPWNSLLQKGREVHLSASSLMVPVSHWPSGQPLGKRHPMYHGISSESGSVGGNKMFKNSFGLGLDIGAAVASVMADVMETTPESSLYPGRPNQAVGEGPLAEALALHWASNQGLEATSWVQYHFHMLVFCPPTFEFYYVCNSFSSWLFYVSWVYNHVIWNRVLPLFFFPLVLMYLIFSLVQMCWLTTTQCETVVLIPTLIWFFKCMPSMFSFLYI